MALASKKQRLSLRAKCVVISVLAWALTDPIRSEPMPASVRVCRSQVDELQRLRCYDAAVDGSTQANTVPAPVPSTVPAPVPATGPVPATAPATVSTTMPAPVPAPIPARPASSAASRPPETHTDISMFSAKVAALSFRPSGAVNVTLDNGQTWTQYGPEGRVPLQTGDSVTLRPGLFGASILVGPSGWITKVHLIATSETSPGR